MYYSRNVDFRDDEPNPEVPVPVHVPSNLPKRFLGCHKPVNSVNITLIQKSENSEVWSDGSDHCVYTSPSLCTMFHNKNGVFQARWTFLQVRNCPKSFETCRFSEVAFLCENEQYTPNRLKSFRKTKIEKWKSHLVNERTPRHPTHISKKSSTRVLLTLHSGLANRDRFWCFRFGSSKTNFEDPFHFENLNHLLGLDLRDDVFRLCSGKLPNTTPASCYFFLCFGQQTLLIKQVDKHRS